MSEICQGQIWYDSLDNDGSIVCLQSSCDRQYSIMGKTNFSRTVASAAHAFALSTSLPLRSPSSLQSVIHPSISTRRPWRACTTANTTPSESSILTWNVNSLRALLRKDPHALHKLVETYQPDILCLQETKLQQVHEPLFFRLLEDCGYRHVLFNSSRARLGYSGTAIFSRHVHFVVQNNINHEAGDEEGRVLMFEFPGIFLVNVYTVNSGAGLRRMPVRLSWDCAFRRFIRQLRECGKPVIVVGDLNVARLDLDVHDPIAVSGNAGFTESERISFDDLLETSGLVDAFRLMYPHRADAYTYWDYRSAARKRNRGWRIDYALVSDDMVNAVRDVRILDDVMGSDHCPVIIELSSDAFFTSDETVSSVLSASSSSPAARSPL